MSKTLTFYFDYVSPYSFLAQSQLAALKQRTGCEIQFVPAFLGGIHKSQEVKSPAFIPAKAKWIYRDCHLWANHYGITLNWCKQFPFNSIFLLRATLVVQQQNPDRVFDLVTGMFNEIWQNQLDVNDPQAVAAALSKLGFDPQALLDGTAQADIKQALLDNGETAVAKGLFGLPAFEVDDDIFFGQDRLLFVEQALLA